MNKAIKGILITSGVFFIVGLSLLIAGFCAGASWKQIATTLQSGKYNIHGIPNWYDDEFNDMISVESGEYDLKDVKKISIDMAGGELRIKKGNSNQLKVENENDRGKLSVDTSEDSIEIKLKGRISGNGGKATLWIPEGFAFEDIEINVDAGNLLIDSLKSNEMSIDVAAGNVKCTGKIEAQKSEWNVDAGKIQIGWLDSKDVEMNCVAGKIEALLSGKQADYNFEGDCDVGEIEFGEDTYNYDSDEHHDSTKGQQKIKASCDVGKIEIKFEN